MTALAVALVLVAAIAGVIAHRWLSLRYPQTDEFEVDPEALLEKLATYEQKLDSHETRIQALMLHSGLRTQRETRA